MTSETMDEEALTTMTARNETAVAEPEAPVEQTPEKPKPEEKEDAKDIEKRARKPPADGPCKGCGQNKPINRLMLCYKCWVEKKLMDEAKARGEDFIPGIDPHPRSCDCDLPDHNGKGGAPRPSN